MQSRIIGSVAAVIVLGISVYMQKGSTGASNADTYYMVNIIIVSATVAAALALSVIVSYFSRRKKAGRTTAQSARPNRRDHYRIVYQRSQRPLLRIEAPSLALTGEHEFQVLDISEQGLCFLNDQNVHFSETVQGELIFDDGERVAIEGTIVREASAQISLKLSEAIPFKSVVKEQRRIISDEHDQEKFKVQPQPRDSAVEQEE